MLVLSSQKLSPIQCGWGQSKNNKVSFDSLLFWKYSIPWLLFRNWAYWCNLGIQSKDHNSHNFVGFGQFGKSPDHCNGYLLYIQILEKMYFDWYTKKLYILSYATLRGFLPVQSNSSSVSHPGLHSHSPLLQMPLLLQSISLEQ